MENKTISILSSETLAYRRNGQRALWILVGRILVPLLTASAPMLTGLAQASERDESKGSEHWVGTWSNALHEPDLGVPGLANLGFNNQTLRQIVHISIG